MDKTSYNATCLKEYQTVVIGRQMETNYRQFVFNCAGFGDVAEITLVHQRSQDVAPYIVTSETGNTLTWTVTDTDTAFSGNGQAELRVTFADGLAKSVTFRTLVIKSITADTVIPEALQSWYDAMIAYINDHSVTDEQLAQAIADYLEEHPVEAPVTSVNGQQGAVILTAADVGAIADTVTIPTKTSQLQNDSGFISSVPVTSVNGKTGAVNLTASDVNALPASTEIPSKTSDLVNDSGFLSSAVTSFNGSTGAVTYVAPVTSVNAQTGAITVNEVFWCTYGTTTSAEIEAALTAGKIPMVMYQDYAYTLRYRNSTTNHRFVCNYGGKEKSIACQSGTWIPNGDLTFLTTSYTPPVTSVNGQTGAVTVSVPTKTSDLTNDSGFITFAPVASVDGKTGAVTVIPTGGSAGQVLAKASATDRDVEWITPSGGGGNDWQLLHDSTTTEDALLQIALTNISVKEVRIYAIEPAGYTSSVVVYCPLNNSEGNHYDKSYGRPMLSLSNSGSTQKIIMAAQEPIIMNGLIENPTYANNSGGQSNIQLKSVIGTNVTAGMTFTSMSIATYQSVPAGLRIVAFGR